MPTFPWQLFVATEPEREYLVMASQLPLRSFAKVPSFLSMTMAVRKQLAQSEGLVGYSLVAEIPSKRFWTLSAWTDERALNTFSTALPHLDVMRNLRPHMAPTTFVTWRLPGRELPPSWDNARARIGAAKATAPPADTP